MKRPLIPFLLLALLYVTATAQGEWKWAHYWTGQDGNSPGDYYNKIINTAFDDEGNIYVYGTMGGSAVFDGNALQFTTHAEVLSHDDACAILLAKFDTIGNMLWYKVVKSSSEMAFPLWMEVHNNNIYIAGNCGFYGDDIDSWLYYFDTLVWKYEIDVIPIEQQKHPFKTYSRWTFFTTFDTDGNVLEEHFISAYSREQYPHGADSIRAEYNLCINDICPIHIGSDGEVYVYTPIRYKGNEMDPYTISVDGDTAKTYDLLLPGSAVGYNNINNAILYKFSSDWNLEFAKILVSGTDGLASLYTLTGDSVNRYFYVYFKGVSYDEYDNMYLTGYVNAPCGELHDYPVHIWWDSTHCLTLNDISSTGICNFIVKYSTQGEVQWCNQIFSICGDNVNYRPVVSWGRSSIMGNSVLVSGHGGYTISNNSLLYFDDTSTLQYYQYDSEHIGFFVKYDLNDGSYITQGIVPTLNANTSNSISCINNRVFVFSTYNASGYGRLLVQWKDDGTLISFDTIPGGLMENAIPLVNANGYLLAALTTIGTVPVVFGNDLQVYGSTTNSSAVFALYHDPRFAEPFVPDDTVGIETYYNHRESDIYLYPNPTNGEAVVCGYMYDYRSIELFDLQGRKLDDLVETHNGTSLPIIDLTPYPAGTYLVRINFNRGVSVTRKVVKGE